MTSLLFAIALLGVCVLIGKYNKNDNLAMILAIALLGGMAGGAIVKKLLADDEKQDKLKQVSIPTQESPAVSIDLFAMLDDTGAGTLCATNPVGKGKEIPARDIKLSAPSKRIGEILAPHYFSIRNRGGPFKFFDTS